MHLIRVYRRSRQTGADAVSPDLWPPVLAAGRGESGYPPAKMRVFNLASQCGPLVDSNRRTASARSASLSGSVASIANAAGILVENASRLARDLMVQEIILAECRKLGVTVLEADGGNDLTVGSTDPTATLIRQVLGAVSQFEKSVIVLKLRAARQRSKAKNGKCEGRKAYGEKPGEAEIVERIQDLRRKPVKGDRLSFAAIAATLNADNVPTRSGGPWRPSVIGQILGRK